MVQSKTGGSPSGGVLSDTHAASLTGALSVTTNEDTDGTRMGFGGATDIVDAIYSADLGTTETTLVTIQITPSQTTNRVFVTGSIRTQKLTNTGDITIRLKEGAAVLSSQTVTALAANSIANVSLKTTLTDQSAALHTYSLTTLASNTGHRQFFGHITAIGFSTSDSHAASLTGTASCSACECA